VTERLYYTDSYVRRGGGNQALAQGSFPANANIGALIQPLG
jgi:hypothetical protein